MSKEPLQSLSMAKYERLLPRIFPNALHFEVRDTSNDVFWCQRRSEEVSDETGKFASDPDAPVAWSDVGAGLARRQLANGEIQFRKSLKSRAHGVIAWLIVTFDTQQAVPFSSSSELVSKAFSEISIFLQEELELQTECDQLAVELTERYEELNLVYSTKDQVECFEEGQEALVRLVHNCADYLDVGLAALILRENDLTIHHANTSESKLDIHVLLDLLASTVYDRVESQVRNVVLNDQDVTERVQIFSGREENLIAYPILDDHGVVIGLLAVVAQRDLRTFSNGDRNLLEVMAKKASRIIHTHHDSLTGLMNRGGFESFLVSTLANARTNNRQHCLLHLDIDQLHAINDLMGHHIGDNLIRRFATILRRSIRDSDYVARLGGDEFGVLLSNCSLDQGYNVAEKISAAVSDLKVATAQRQLDITVSTGIAAITRETDGIVGVMASSEIACRAAKDAGRNRIEVFEQDNTTLVRRSEEVEWMSRVQEALRDDALMLYCQVVQPLAPDRHPQHFEILVRMRGGNGDVIAPGTFMPAAERFQLMPMVDRWVVHNALAYLGESGVLTNGGRPVFCINLSGQSLSNNGFLTFIKDELTHSGVPANQICFEITETAAISNIDEATEMMNGLQQRGCKFALDDFGAGLSSFGYLKTLPVDYLKIDGSFVSEMINDPVSMSMVTAIAQIGRTMGLSTVAEFVADKETENALRVIGVDYVQGFGIGKPVPIEDVVNDLNKDAGAATA